MIRIGMLHTVQSVMKSFGAQLQEAFAGQELTLCHTLDEYLATDAVARGFTQANLNRLLLLLQAIELEEPDLIVVSCSSLSAGVAKIRPFLRTRVIAIDDAMADRAIHTGRTILVLATARSAAAALREKLLSDGKAAGLAPEVRELVCPDAFEALRRMDGKVHDELVKQAAAQIGTPDVVVLAQASMAHLENDVARICGRPALSSPGLCIAQIREYFFH